MKYKMPMLDFEKLVVNDNIEVPLINGRKINYINLDNAASTPPFKAVISKINEVSKYYSSIHRGSGFKSRLCTDIYDKTRSIVAKFVGVNENTNSIIFVKNSTEAVNKLANCYSFNEGDIVICSRMEHHSNDLPWRDKAIVKYIEVKENGELDLDNYIYLLNKYGSNIRLVTVTGASNVTGYVNPINYMATLAHEIGAKILVDASQLVSHLRVDMKADNDSQHIDYIVFTGHKMYAPFGIGVLIGPKRFFNERKPDVVGGGIVRIVTDDNVYWELSPEKNEAGTPNFIGAVALASSIKVYEQIGIDKIEENENLLMEYLLNSIKNIQKIKVYGHPNAEPDKRTCVLAFNIEGVNHSLVSSILSYEYGIGVRNGCFCAHPYVLRLLHVEELEAQKHKMKILNGDKSMMPGLVRVSLGIYNTFEDIDRLILALKNIAEGNYENKYIQNKKDGSYLPKEDIFNFENIFEF